jgi:heme o synthase
MATPLRRACVRASFAFPSPSPSASRAPLRAPLAAAPSPSRCVWRRHTSTLPRAPDAHAALAAGAPPPQPLHNQQSPSSTNNDESDAASRAASSSGAGGLARSFAELSKVRLSSLVVLTSGAGFLLAGGPVDWAACAAAVTGTSLAAAAANTFNQVYEVRTDGLMKRTMNRPLPAGRITRGTALAFGAATTACSVGVLLAGTNPLTAALGLGNIALYALVYTPLKQISPLNTAVGAVVGAIPPLMGWAAATGSLAAVDPFLLAYALFAWQFPHFYSLAWTLRKDYARGGYQMVPCLDPTGKWTATLSLRHAALLSAVPLVTSALGVTNPMFAVEGLLLNGYFLALTRRFYADPGDHTARPVFRTSLWYLPVLIGLMVFHSTAWAREEEEEAAAAAAATAALGAGTPGAAAAVLDGLQEGSRQPQLQPVRRGSTVGEAIEHAVSNARALGRSICAHELYVGGTVGSYLEAVRVMLGGTPDANGEGVFAAAPGAAATRVAGAAVLAHAGASSSSSSPSPPPASSSSASPTSSSDSSVLEAAEAGAKARTRGMCPVVVAEEKAEGMMGISAGAAATKELQRGLR